jgi:hypothetical protein
MKREFRHPQIFSDVLLLCQMYYTAHNNLPKPFRYAVGELVLAELAQALRLIVRANAVDKQRSEGCREGAALVREIRAGVEVVRGFLMLAWKLQLLSHGALAQMSLQIEAISKQAARWQQWFEDSARRCGSEGSTCNS